MKVMPSKRSKAHHQARDDAWGRKSGGSRSGANPFTKEDRKKGAALTKKILDRAKKK